MATELSLGNGSGIYILERAGNMVLKNITNETCDEINSGSVLYKELEEPKILIHDYSKNEEPCVLDEAAIEKIYSLVTKTDGANGVLLYSDEMPTERILEDRQWINTKSIPVLKAQPIYINEDETDLYKYIIPRKEEEMVTFAITPPSNKSI
ncbi:MAG: hypothetical protein KAI53_02400 [Candidatus Aenigmarchaeota archaeon]|nr:hypothetical protein [Candidatus Aenigmarchaeota archaeon]